MRKIISIIVLISAMFLLLMGCSNNSEMRQTDKKTETGLPQMTHQINQTERGANVIVITEEITYPGMTRYEDAKYEFVAEESPEKVAKWFEDNLKDATVERKTASAPTDTKWVVTYKDLIIDIVYGPNQTDTLIRYKKDITKKQ